MGGWLRCLKWSRVGAKKMLFGFVVYLYIVVDIINVRLCDKV